MPRRTLAIVLGALTLLVANHAWGDERNDPQRREAMRLYDENRLVQALPLFEQLATRAPEDLVVQERLGICWLAAAATEKDPEKASALRRKARAALLKAQKLGDDSNLLKSVLPTIPEDGSFPEFSQRKEVDDAMRKGEAAFVRGHLPGAIDHYTRALLFDPNLYVAALFIGDCYFKMNQHASAEMWFRNAVEIDPNLETAHRYWGDVLVRSGKLDEARARFADAVIAEPYNQRSWMGLSQWADQAKIQLSHPRIMPSTSTDAAGREVPRPLRKEDGTESWKLYDTTRAFWREGFFRKKFPAESRYRHSLAEEADALQKVANQVANDLQAGVIRDLDADLAILVGLNRSGLLESFILLARPDEGIAQDYAGYRKSHREQLAQFINRYVIDHNYGPASDEAPKDKRGPSTPQERARALQLIRELEEDPLGPGAKEARRWLITWIEEIPDISVTACQEPFGKLLESKEEHASSLFFQATFSTAAWLIENPGLASDRVSALMAGVEGTLRAYESLRRQKPQVRWTEMEELVQKRNRGLLASDLKPRLAKCLDGQAKGSN